jgi:cytochrome c oxidase cbb3-type subunit 3
VTCDVLMRNFVVLISVAVAMAGCQREERELRLDPPVAAALDKIALMPNGISGAPPNVYFALDKPYESNAYNLSQGKRLYSWFGCKTCHSDGQGGTGPAFLDGWWNYGPEMVSIFASIRDGRPHGMPAFRDKMTTEQIWQLAGYVQTIGAYSAKTAAPSRNDEKHTRPSENRAPAAKMFDQGPTPVHADQGPTP